VSPSASVSPSEPPTVVEEEPILLRNRQLVDRAVAARFGVSAPLVQQTIPSWNTLGRPKKPKEATIGFNLETLSLDYWNGSAWLTLKMRKI